MSHSLDQHLDLTTDKDRNKLVRAITHNWNITPETMRFYSDALQHATQLAIRDEDPQAIRACAQTFLQMVAQFQSDEQFAKKQGTPDTAQEVVVRFEQKPSAVTAIAVTPKALPNGSG